MKLYARISIFAKIISFDSDTYFWEKRAVMFACNLISQNCEKFVPWFSETFPALKNSWLRACNSSVKNNV